MLSRDIVYRVPIRVTRELAHAPGFSEKGYHMYEDWGSLETRVERLETEYAWAEDPPSRVRRFVTNIQVLEANEEEIRVRSYLLVTRNRLEDIAPHFISAERVDVLRKEGDEWKLKERTVYLDHTILPTPNLGIFL